MATTPPVNSQLTAEADALAQSFVRANEAARKAADLESQLRDAKRNLANSITSLGRAVSSTDNSLSKYNSSIGQASSAIGNLAKMFLGGGILGKGVSLLANALGGLAQDILKQTDSYLKAKDALNQFGFNSTLTALEIAKMGRNAGYTSEELEKYTSIITSLGADALALGHNFGDASVQFGKLTANSLDVIAAFGKMGVSQEQLNKNQASYIRLMSIQGIQVTDSMKQGDALKKSSLEYTKNLLTLAALSGEDIESIKKKQEAARADMNFNIGQTMKAKEAAELEAKIGDAEAQARAKRLRQEIKANEELQNIAITMGLSGQDLSAFSQMIQTGTFTELSAKFAPFGSNLLSLIKDVQAGKRDASALAIEMAKMGDRTLEAVGQAATLSASEISSVIMLDANMIKNSARLRGMSEEQYVKMVKAEAEKRERQNKKGIDQEADIREREFIARKALNLAREDLTDLVRGGLLKVIEMMQKAFAWVARGILKAFKWLPGVDTKAADNLIQALTPIEDLKDEMEKLQKERGTIAAQIAGGVQPGQVQATREATTGRITELDLEAEQLKQKLSQNLSKEEKEAIEIKLKAVKEEIFAAQAKLRSLGSERKVEEELARRKKALEETEAKIRALKEQIEQKERDSGPVRDVKPATGGGATGPGGGSLLSSGSSGTIRSYNVEDLAAAGIKLRPSGGDLHRAGAGLDERIFSMMQAISKQDWLDYISGANDQFHQGMSSQHNKGLAFDFKIKGPYNREIGQKVTQWINSNFAGAQVMNEYENPSRQSTAPHFHVQYPQARFGAMPEMVSAPTSGRLMEVHNREAVAMVNNGSAFSKLLTATPEEASSMFNNNEAIGAILDAGLSKVAGKLDLLIEQVSTLNSTEEEMLMYSRNG